MNNKIAGHLFAIFTIAVWGTTFIASKSLLEFFSPTQIMMMRFVLAYIMLIIIRPEFKKPQLREELYFLLMGFIGCTVYFFTENTAMLFTSATNASIMVAFSPVITGIAAHFLTKDEKLNIRKIIGFIIAFSGTLLVVFNGAFVLKLNPLGDMLAFLSACSWSAYVILQKRALKNHSSFYISRKVMFYGFLTGLPLLLREGGISLAPLSDMFNLGYILFLGLLGSAACYVTFAKASERIGIVATNTYVYAQPFITMLAANLILGERITPIGLSGAVLIVCGIIFADKSAKKVTV